MTRRMIDTSIWSNESFSYLPPYGRLLLLGMVNHADDQGRLKANPAWLRAQVFPYDDMGIDEVEGWLQQIAANGTLQIYKVESKQYAQMLKWWDYQSMNFAAPSKYPPPPDWNDRIRYTAKGRIILTYNWTDATGKPVKDTCGPYGRPCAEPYGQPHERLIEDKDKDKDKPKGGASAAAVPDKDDDFAKLVTMWEQNMVGTMTPFIKDDLISGLDDYGFDAMKEGIKAAVANGKQRAGTKYVLACARHEVEGTAPTGNNSQRMNYGSGASLNNLDKLERKMRNGISITGNEAPRRELPGATD